MHENENEVPSRVPERAVDEAPPVEEGQVEERQAEEFAGEMNAEPKNIDGEPGVATPEEEAAAEQATQEPEAAAEAASTEPEASAAPEAVSTEPEAPAAPEGASTEPEAPAADEAMSTEPEASAAPWAVSTEPEAPGAPWAVSIEPEAPGGPRESLSADEILAPDAGKEQLKWPAEDAELTAMLEAVIYITDEPLTLEQMSTVLEQPRDRIKRLLNDLVAEWQKPHHGLSIREVAGGYKMTTKPEHHDAVRQFVKNLKPPMKLSLPALETLAVIAYKQPVTAPEIMDIRGVQGAGVLKTLIDRKLIAPAGRKNVIGKPILYKTTREFLVQFGLKDLAELPSVKEFEELARFATGEPESAPSQPPQPPVVQPEEEPQPEPAPEPVVE